jgi:hypothetical protein
MDVQEGATPLVYASMYGLADIVTKLLIQGGALTEIANNVRMAMTT